MPRLLFTKNGDAIWMSHLDLMRLFQRAFKRAGLPLTHTQGYNPRPSVSIALPLSVGMESKYELLDFELDGAEIPCQEITDRLNQVLVPGVCVLETYTNGRKINEIVALECSVTLKYDRILIQKDMDAITDVLTRKEIIVTKKGKNGPVEQDIKPMIYDALIVGKDEHTIRIVAMVSCQNPSLNPMLLVSAIERYAPEQAPDHALCCRLKLYDKNNKAFR